MNLPLAREPCVLDLLKGDRLRLQYLRLKKDWQERILVLFWGPCSGQVPFRSAILSRSGSKQSLWYNALALLNAGCASD